MFRLKVLLWGATGDVGQQTFAQFKNSRGVKAATADREQLMDLQTERMIRKVALLQLKIYCVGV